MSYTYSDYKKNSFVSVNSICDMLSKNYAIYLRKFKDDDLNEINRKIFDWWYLQNYERIWKSENEKKIERLRIVKERRDTHQEDEDCFTLLHDLIFIEMNFVKHDYENMYESTLLFVTYCDRVGIMLKKEFKIFKKELKKYCREYKKNLKKENKKIPN